MSFRVHQERRANEVTARAMADPLTASVYTEGRLTIDGVEYVPRAMKYRCEDVRSGESYAMILEVTLPGHHPDTIEGKTAEAHLLVADPSGSGAEASEYVAEWLEFHGKIKDYDQTDDGDTTFDAYTPGEVLSRQWNGAVVSWSGHSPKMAMHGAVKDAGYTRVDLRDVPERPLLYREEDEVFEVRDVRSTQLADIREQAQAVFFDDPDGAGRGMSLAALKVPTTSGVPAFSYTVGTHIRPGKFKATTDREGRFSHVAVTREKPTGGIETIELLEIDNGDVYVPDFTYYEIPVADLTAEALSTALGLGSQMALALGRGAWSFEAETLLLDPRIVRGTHGTIDETRRERDPQASGEFDVFRRWAVSVCGYSRDPITKTPTMMGAAYKLIEVKTPVEKASSLASPVSAGVVSASLGVA